jgi:hypothetical protein
MFKEIKVRLEKKRATLGGKVEGSLIVTCDGRKCELQIQNNYINRLYELSRLITGSHDERGVGIFDQQEYDTKATLCYNGVALTVNTLKLTPNMTAKEILSIIRQAEELVANELNKTAPVFHTIDEITG